jgi:hypothetical protein
MMLTELFGETSRKVWREGVKGEGKLPGVYSVIHASETRKTFGELKGYGESVTDVLAQWADLKKRDEREK